MIVYFCTVVRDKLPDLDVAVTGQNIQQSEYLEATVDAFVEIDVDFFCKTEIQIHVTLHLPERVVRFRGGSRSASGRIGDLLDVEERAKIRADRNNLRQLRREIIEREVFAPCGHGKRFASVLLTERLPHATA